MAETDRECGTEEPLESRDMRRLLTGIRDADASLWRVLRVPELGGVGYVPGIGGISGWFREPISLRLRL